ncbi:EamA family transporter [Pedomonas sp. V897]|uniref:EamA family transporter n=1 Tax=Pedomonas sp. V897 TaxID=3446482 RepID=UPI003EE02C4F
MPRASLSFPHFLLALAVVAVWGTNFVVIRFGLNHLPPLLFAALRFGLVFLPAALFIRRPNVPLVRLAAYGVAIGAGQFGLLFLAMKKDISPGLASLVVQSQAFFTIGLAIALTRERLRAHQWLAVGLAASGIVLIGYMGGGDATPLGLLLVLLAGFSWAAGNLIARSTPGVNMLAYVVWSSLFAVPPLLALSLIFEGPQAILTGLAEADAATWAAVLWQSVGNSMFGYAAFGWLLARYPAATVAPMSLLVPVFGMAASAWWLGESLPLWKLAAAAIVLGGLAINLFWRPRAKVKPAA